jgi:hypothetical protein
MEEKTLFSEIYDCFFGKITEDMYLELTHQDTFRDCQSILLNAIPFFEFPRFALYEYTVAEVNDGVDNSYYNMKLSQEEINILALLMKQEWLNRQINSIELIRQKYYGSDFKMTSQANHLAKLNELADRNLKESMHMQRLYKRRKTEDNGRISSNWSCLGTSVFD